MYSQDFSKHYDALMGDSSTIVKTTKKLIKEYAPSHAEILELGCGTGTVLKELPKNYTLSGLDYSEGMLAIAKKKAPHVTYYLADMRTFSLPQKYDLIYSVFDSVNHLTSLSDWKKLFFHVKKHLKKEGVFIFDINTLRRLDGLASMPTYIKKLDKNTLSAAKIAKHKPSLYSVTFQVFENIQKDKDEIKYFDETVYEATFDLQTIQDTLAKSFAIERMIDPYRTKLSKKTGRVFFVCRKK